MTAATSRTRSDVRIAISLGLAFLAMATLVSLTLLIVRAETPLVLVRVSEIDQINRLATYQGVVLIVVGVIAVATFRLLPDNFARYFRIGSLAAPATPVRALGIKGTETWTSLGLTFSVVISVVTAAIVLVPAARTGLTLSPYLAGVAVVLAASNAFVEEYLTRFQVVVSLAGRVAPVRIAVVSALLFGLPHYLGTPGQLIGVLAATFLGWFLAKSVLETKGLGWAWFVHFLQDVIIFLAILGTMALHGG